MTLPAAARSILPLNSQVNAADHLVVGGCDVVELAQEYGTPLYVYDEQTIRARAREYVQGLRNAYPNGLVIYACKAFTSPALLDVLREEGLGLDVVSGGELYVAVRAAFPLDRVYFHGNNKSREELEMALDLGVGRVVVDNLYELDLLDQVARHRGKRQEVLLRLTPGVEAHTHDYRKTGILDSKFGIPITTGQAEDAVKQALSLPGIELLGFHSHIGSQIYEIEPYVESIRIVLEFARHMSERHGLQLREFSPGGGWGIAYTPEDDPQPIGELVATVAEAVNQMTGYAGKDAPRLVLEPGRSIVGSAAVALYTVGSIKRIPDVRTYVAVDGGMADNIRPAIYGARYEALLAGRMSAPAAETVTVAGKYCESGDVLIRDARLPELRPGDVLALPASGAYNLAMASNYNNALKPAVVMVKDGQARLIRRRQTFEDLVREEVL
jgi:diaminopimelate decarboxylase